MTDPRKYSAAEESTGRFPAHGRVSLEICDNIARYEAWWPFNQELLRAYLIIQERVIPKMMAKSRWEDACLSFMIFTLTDEARNGSVVTLHTSQA